MSEIRLIPCLDIENGEVVKGVKFKNLEKTGDPVSMAINYNEEGAKEIVLLNIGKTSPNTMLKLISTIKEQTDLSITAGGGIDDLESMKAFFAAGAARVSLCTRAIENPNFLKRGALTFGKEAIVLAIDAGWQGKIPVAYSHGGKVKTEINAVEWAEEGSRLGAGEILLTSLDRDGTQIGYDNKLIKAIKERVDVPVIASGGAGELDHLLRAIKEGGADGVLVASLLHFAKYSVGEIKSFFESRGVNLK